MKDFFKNLFVFLLGVGAFIYLIIESTIPLAIDGAFNAGILAASIIGNFDDTTAVVLLLSSLNYFGINLTGFLGRKSKR